LIHTKNGGSVPISNTPSYTVFSHVIRNTKALYTTQLILSPIIQYNIIAIPNATMIQPNIQKYKLVIYNTLDVISVIANYTQ